MTWIFFYMKVFPLLSQCYFKQSSQISVSKVFFYFQLRYCSKQYSIFLQCNYLNWLMFPYVSDSSINGIKRILEIKLRHLQKRSEFTGKLLRAIQMYDGSMIFLRKGLNSKLNNCFVWKTHLGTGVYFILHGLFDPRILQGGGMRE